MMLLARIGFSLLFGAVGLYLLMAAVRLIKVRRAWSEGGVVTEGEIIDFVSVTPTGSSAARRKLFAPIVTFSTESGVAMRFTSGMSQNPNPYTVGQRVTVRYLRDEPTTADLDSVTRGWMAFVVIVIFVVVTLTVASLPWILPPPAPR
jgi:hypothetical protein